MAKDTTNGALLRRYLVNLTIVLTRVRWVRLWTESFASRVLLAAQVALGETIRFSEVVLTTRLKQI